MVRLVRVISDRRPFFVAGFETDGVVRRCAPILRRALLGRTDEDVRAILHAKGWRAHVVERSGVGTEG